MFKISKQPKTTIGGVPVLHFHILSIGLSGNSDPNNSINKHQVVQRAMERLMLGISDQKSQLITKSK